MTSVLTSSICHLLGRYFFLRCSSARVGTHHSDPSGIRSFAVDSKNDLIFAANYYGGYIDVIDLRSQRTRKYIIAQGLGRHINLKPAEKSGFLHTRGLGMYRFDYSDVAASPSGAILSPQLSRGSDL